jgi:hypothetical protein
MVIHLSAMTEERWMASASGIKDTGRTFCEKSHIISGKWPTELQRSAFGLDSWRFFLTSSIFIAQRFVCR